MIRSDTFFKSVLDAIAEHIAVIDHEGAIRFVNSSWIRFAHNNSYPISTEWIGINYLKICDESAAAGDELAFQAAAGIRKVIHNEQTSFYFEYPCHSPDEARWFMMTVTPFSLDGSNFYVLSHQNITQRRLAEDAALALSRLDGLTNIPNRRYFDEFLKSEWKRCARLKLPITIAMIDLDHFKLLNDTYGHQMGDECLKEVALLLKKFANRPSDMCARYGGEEFVIVYGNTTLEASLDMMEKLLDEVRTLKIPNAVSPVIPVLTISIGLATMYPNADASEEELIKAADVLLYSAKNNGRNRIAHQYR